MRYTIYNIILAFTLLALPVAGQQMEFPISDMAGGVSYSSLELKEQGDSLHFSMDIHVWGRALNKRQSWSIYPVLSTQDGQNRVEMPCMLINGIVKEQHYTRKMQYGSVSLLNTLPDIKVDIEPQTDTIVRYVVNLPYELWMDDASLSIYQVLGSSADKRQMFSMESALKVELTPREPYQVQPMVNYLQPEAEQKQRKMQGQAFLDFQAGRSNILPDYRRNPEELAKIAAAIQQVQNDPDVEILGLFIEGYASPEGQYATNQRLAQERSESLKNYMVSNFGLDGGLCTVRSGGEDWDGLRLMVEESEIAQKERVLGIIDNSSTYDVKKQQLRALGAPWRAMNAEMFPQLRRVEYQIDFSVKDYSLEETRNIAGRNPEMLSHRELYTLAGSYPEGSSDRDRILDMIIRHFPDDPVALINNSALMLSHGEDMGAKRQLDRVADDARSWNNMGVYLLKAGELDKAQEYFTKAKEEFPEQAEHNLGEVRKKRDDNIKMERYNKARE